MQLTPEMKIVDFTKPESSSVSFPPRRATPARRSGANFTGRKSRRVVPRATLVLIALQRGRGSSIVMDRSPSRKIEKASSKARVDSSKKQQKSEAGSRATKLKALDAQLTKLDATLRLLDVEFEACEMLIVDILMSREVLIRRVHSIIETLETTLIYRQYAENARKKIDEKRDEVSMELRDPNLDAKREQQLQETIENLAEIQEDLGKTERGVELSHTQCVRSEARLNVLINTNESMHRRLCEKLVNNERSCREVLAKRSKLRATRRAIENEDSSHEI